MRREIIGTLFLPARRRKRAPDGLPRRRSRCRTTILRESAQMSRFTLSRRAFAKTAGAAALASALPMPFVRTASAATELIHWSWLAASDGEVWAQMIQSFNDAHKDKGVQIKMEVVPEDQYNTKVLAAA